MSALTWRDGNHQSTPRPSLSMTAPRSLPIGESATTPEAIPSSSPGLLPALLIDNLHKSFGSLSVLRGVSLETHQHSVISIIGSSGSGKSTLLRCINFLETPDEGRIAVAGEDVRVEHGGRISRAQNRQIERLRSRVGFVFQSFNLWTHFTVLENVIEGPLTVLHQERSEVLARAEKLLEDVGLGDKRHAYPHELSGGQQQRVAIARALGMEPQILLFDEPTSALDPELVGEVLKVIRELAEQGRTMLIVTHEMGFAREVSSEVIFLHDGRVEERNTPEALFGAPQSERCRQFLNSVL
ncbi:MAG: ATP-binding cassette domain-containing protein [Pseudomonadota bacterium]